MDSDALIKLTKASSKELVASEFQLILSPEVELECVEQGKASGHPDALVIEENLRAGLLGVSRIKKDPATETIIKGLGLSGGEAGVLRLSRSGGVDIIVGDDRRFLQILEGLRIAFTTPAALLVVLAQRGRLSTDDALERLGRLADYISEGEYMEARRALELG